MARARGAWARRALLGLGLVALAAGCRTQRWPGPMTPSVLPLPPGDTTRTEAGLDEVLAVRHSDPVLVRQPGSSSGYPLSLYEKRNRLRSGGWLMTGAGGRAELFWPLEGGNIQLTGISAVIVGERSADEPAAWMREVTYARIWIGEGDRIGLPSGALLYGGAEELSGPFVVEARRGDVLRLINQSPGTAYVDYRDTTLAVGPGQSLDLPRLEAGTAPIERIPGVREVAFAGRTASLEGGSEVLESTPDWIRVEAAENGLLQALGLEVELHRTGPLVLSGLGAAATDPE
jgi:hypothetical protein